MDNKKLVDNINDLCIDLEDILKCMQNTHSDKILIGIRLKTFEFELDRLRIEMENS